MYFWDFCGGTDRVLLAILALSNEIVVVKVSVLGAGGGAVGIGHGEGRLVVDVNRQRVFFALVRT